LSTFNQFFHRDKGATQQVIETVTMLTDHVIWIEVYAMTHKRWCVEGELRVV